MLCRRSALSEEFFTCWGICVSWRERDRLESRRSKRAARCADRWIGVDLNTKGHVAVVANPHTGKVLKLGGDLGHVHMKYLAIRNDAHDRPGKKNLCRRLKRRHHATIRDRLHKISQAVVREAKAHDCGIRMEDLNFGTKSHERTAGYTMASWTFRDLVSYIEHKARQYDVPVEFVNPSHTSKACSRCGQIGIRSGKKFRCPHCGHADHADVNAAFNIALRNTVGEPDQSGTDRDMPEGRTDAPIADVLPWRLGEFDVEGLRRR